MATDDRKQQILDHIALTSSNMNFQSTPQKLEFTPPPAFGQSSRVMEHLSRTSNLSGMSSDQRKLQILKHIQKTMG
jgi:hypothetical protein